MVPLAYYRYDVCIDYREYYNKYVIVMSLSVCIVLMVTVVTVVTSTQIRRSLRAYLIVTPENVSRPSIIFSVTSTRIRRTHLNAT